jgi:hypothetical protein
VRRHEIDAVSLVAGLLFLVVAWVHIVARSTETDLNLRWMVPAVLVLLGVLGLLSAVRFPRREPAGDAADAAAVAAAPESAAAPDTAAGAPDTAADAPDTAEDAVKPDEPEHVEETEEASPPS